MPTGKQFVKIDSALAHTYLRSVMNKFPAQIAKGINRTILDIREAEAVHIASHLQWHAPNAKGFIANERSWPFKPATASTLRGTIFTADAAGRIIATQDEGYTLRPSSSADVEANLMRLHLEHPLVFAIPKENAMRKLMSARGRVPKAYTPMALKAKEPIKRQQRAMGRRGRGRPLKIQGPIFINRRKTGLFLRGAGRTVTMLYAFFKAPAKVRKHLDTFGVAEKTANRYLVARVHDEIMRFLSGAGKAKK